MSRKRKRHKAPPKKVKAISRGPSAGTSVIWPKGARERIGISGPTLWRWEKHGKLPKRDVFVAGKPIGWRPETFEAALRATTVS